MEDLKQKYKEATLKAAELIENISLGGNGMYKEVCNLREIIERQEEELELLREGNSQTYKDLYDSLDGQVEHYAYLAREQSESAKFIWDELKRAEEKIESLENELQKLTSK